MSEVNAILALQHPNIAMVRPQGASRPLVKIKSAILVENARVVGVAHAPIPFTRPDDRIFRAALDFQIHAVPLRSRLCKRLSEAFPVDNLRQILAIFPALA